MSTAPPVTTTLPPLAPPCNVVSEHPLLAQYSAAFQRQLDLYSALQEQQHVAQGLSDTELTPLSPTSLSRRQKDFKMPSVSLQPITFATKLPPADQPQPKNQALIHLSPKEVAIFKTVRKIVNYYGLKCNPRVAGGWVRDKLLHKESHDIDIALEGMEGEDFARYIREYSQTVDDPESFPTGEEISSIAVIKSNPTQSKHLNTATFRLSKQDIDVSNLRTEVYAIDSRIPMMQMGSVRDDVIRRDFTCNALFYNIMTEEIEDVCGRSKFDLDNQIISTPLHAFKTFNDDPLRVLRCVRFASRLRFTIDSPIYYAASHSSTHINLVKKVSRERYGIELKKVFESFTTTQFSLSLLCQWKLRPLIFMLPMAPYNKFKAQSPVPKGKQKQDEMNERLKTVAHLDHILHSQVVVNPACAVRFPMYSLYDLTPRTVFQALYPKEFAAILSEMHQKLIPSQTNGTLQTPAQLGTDKYSFEFAPYAQKDALSTSFHEFDDKKYTESLTELFKKNQFRLRDFFGRENVPFDVEFVSNSNPYYRKHFPSEVGEVDCFKTRERPVYPPPLSFYTLHEDTCLTSLCSQSLSSFRILCEKVYRSYFCTPSLPGITLMDQDVSPMLPTGSQSTISPPPSSSSMNDKDVTPQPGLISIPISIPIRDVDYKRLTTLSQNKLNDPATFEPQKAMVNVRSMEEVSDSRLIPLEEYCSLHVPTFDFITPQLKITEELQDTIYDAFHMNALSSNNLATRTPTEAVYTQFTPTTLPTHIIVYSRDIGTRDNCTRVQNDISDQYSFQNTAMGSPTEIVITDDHIPNLSLLPINTNLFPKDFKSHDNYSHTPSQTGNASEGDKNNAINRGLLSIITSTSSTSVLSAQFHSHCLERTPTPSIVAQFSVLSELGVKRFDGKQKRTPVPTPILGSGESTPGTAADPDKGEALVATQPILPSRIQTPYTPSDEIFRIGLYAAFLWPYYGFNMVGEKGKQKSILYHFLVDSLKLSIEEGSWIEIIIESALSVIQLSYQWTDLIESIRSQLSLDETRAARDAARKVNSSFGLDKITHPDYQPLNHLCICPVNPLLAQRITSIQTQLGAILTKTVCIFAPDNSPLSPTLYNSVLDVIILLAFNIQTVMNMPLYKLPQPQHNVTLKSTLEYTHPDEMVDYDFICDPIPYSDAQLMGLSSSTPTTPTTPHLSRSNSSSDKSQRQQTRTERLMKVLTHHPLVAASQSHSVISSTQDQQTSISPNSEIHQPLKKVRRDEDHSLDTNANPHNVRLPSPSVQRIESMPSRDSISRESDLRTNNLIAVYEPLSTSPNQLNLNLLPQPIQDHYLKAATPMNCRTIREKNEDGAPPTPVGLSTIQREQAYALQQGHAMSQYHYLIPPQPRHTPYIHDEIPSTYSLFCYPGLSSQIEFETTAPVQPHHNELQQITPSVAVQRRLNLDSLPIVMYSARSVMLTQHGFNLGNGRSARRDLANSDVKMIDLVNDVVNLLALKLKIDFNNHSDVDRKSYHYYGIEERRLDAHITHQKTSLVIIYGLGQGYFRLRTTPIAQFVQDNIYNTVNVQSSMQYLHTLQKSLFPGEKARELNGNYQALYEKNVADFAQGVSGACRPLHVPYAFIRGPIMGKINEHLFELKCWYPHMTPDDLHKVVEMVARFEVIPSNDTTFEELKKAINPPQPKKK